MLVSEQTARFMRIVYRVIFVGGFPRYWSDPSPTGFFVNASQGGKEISLLLVLKVILNALPIAFYALKTSENVCGQLLNRNKTGIVPSCQLFKRTYMYPSGVMNVHM